MKYFSSLLFVFLFYYSHAQMWNGQDTLYGNEWINFDQEYFKIKVAKDGIYRINSVILSQAGIPISSIEGGQFEIYHLGEQVPLYVSTNTTFGDLDFIEFYGKQNRSQLDTHLFKDPENDMLNPRYSLFSDTAAYFLSWKMDSGAGLNYELQENELANLPAKEPYCWSLLEEVYKGEFDKKTGFDNVSQSVFDVAEGFGKGFPSGTKRNNSLEPIQVFAGGPDAAIEVRFSCGSGAHQQAIALNDNIILEEVFSDYQVRNVSFEVPANVLTGSDVVSVEGLADSNDKPNVASVTCKYPRTFDFEGLQSMTFFAAASNTRKYLEVENFNLNNGTPVLYDLSNGFRMTGVVEGAIVRIALPPATQERKLILFNSNSGFTQVQNLSTTNFIDYTAEDANYIILSNNALFSEGSSTDNQVEEYADYRRSEQGGSFETIVVEIQQLYDQFAYGINRHPISIRNFTHFVKKEWTDLQYLFIIGKGREYRYARKTQELQESINQTYFVPTYGWPGADNLLVADQQFNIPSISIGRLAATSAQEIKLYLDKVKAHESNRQLPQTLADKAWMKRIIHLGGGDLTVQNTIKNNLSWMANIIENNKFGGEVHSFFKNSSDPIQISQSDVIFDLINEGVSIVSFYGHSSPNAFDFNIDNPESYQNENKYFGMFSLGCFSGQIHNETPGIGERFVFENDKAAICFMSSTGFGYVTALRTFVGEYYNKLGGDFYGKGVADILRATCAGLAGSNALGIRELIQQFTLLGDPAVQLNSHPGPDFLVDASSVVFEPVNVSLRLDNFDLEFEVVNIGRNDADSIWVEVVQERPDGIQIVVAKEKIKDPGFRKKLSYQIPVLGEEVVGLNQIFIRVDAEEEVEELPMPVAELNNELVNASGQVGTSLFIFSDDVLPVYPTEYSIVNTSNIKLSASTANPFAERQTYHIEIDTTQYFNSVIKTQTEIIQEGGVVEWEPNINFHNNAVYYWRISPDSISGEGFRWRNSSFLYLEDGNEGWNQSHHFQYQANRFENMEIEENTRTLKFLDDVKDIKIINSVIPLAQNPKLIINGDGVQSYVGNTVNAGLYIAVLDSITVEPWTNPPGGAFDSYNNHATRTLKAFPFRTDSPEERTNVINFLENAVPFNNYVAIWSIQRTDEDYHPEDWAIDSLNLGKNLFQILEAQGATMIRSTSIGGALPYAFFYKKDAPSYVPGEFVGTYEMESEQTFQVAGSWDNGLVESVKIGPASDWNSLNWEMRGFDPISDKASLNIYGMGLDDGRVLLKEGILTSDTTLSFVSATEFPFLQLQFEVEDSTFRTAPQLDHWQVLYEGIPDAALNPNATFALNEDTLQQGQPLQLEVAIDNLSQYPMDSLLMKYIIRSDNNEEQILYKRTKPLPAQDRIITTLQVDTRNLSGSQQLTLVINPEEDQPEQFHFNNIGLTRFFVEKDQRNPQLDVTFDGVHLMNGDIVSPRPDIVISLVDENEFLGLTDTSLFKVFLQYPGETTVRNIPFDEQVMRFFPALPGNDNKASIALSPVFTTDGMYQLIVQAADATGNQSGAIDYKVSFEIITKAMISNVFNYPNPFSTATQFVYTLTGEEPPAWFKIQIMTVSGRIVREITQTELGPLKIGTHRTDYVWNGTDEFGDRLANGVYLYRVIAQKNDGTNYESYDTGTDHFFEKGIGKLVILR